MILRPEDDLTAVPKGTPDADKAPAPAAAVSPVPADKAVRGVAPTSTRTADAPLIPPGSGEAPRPPSLASSLRRLEEQLAARGGPVGVRTGTGQQIGGFFFDPEGADFTAWVNHLKNEVYRNWILPPAATMGARGHVDLEFTVERDGRMSDVRVLKSSGTPALDRAARNALLGSRLQMLPADYGRSSLTIQVSFYYNESPQG
jgi:protein TonB